MTTSVHGIGASSRRLFDHIEVFYNNQRRHSTLGQISPREFERRHAQKMAALPGAPADSGSPFGRPSIDGSQWSPNREVIDATKVAV